MARKCMEMASRQYIMSWNANPEMRPGGWSNYQLGGSGATPMEKRPLEQWLCFGRLSFISAFTDQRKNLIHRQKRLLCEVLEEPPLQRDRRRWTARQPEACTQTADGLPCE